MKNHSQIFNCQAKRKQAKRFLSPSYRIFIIASIGLLFLISCATKMTKEHIPGYKSTTALSFAKYAELGFLITPYKYLGDYKSVGIISVVAMPEAKLTTKKVLNKAYPASSAVEYKIERNWKIEKIDIEEVLDKLYEDALEMGADAIVEFTISENTDHHIVGYQGKIPLTLELVGVELSGFAIKRLGAFKSE